MRLFSGQAVHYDGKIINLLNTSAFFHIRELETAIEKIAKISRFSNLKNLNFLILHTQTNATAKAAKLLQKELAKQNNYAFVSQLLLNRHDCLKISKNYDIDFFLVIRKNSRNDNIVLEIFNHLQEKISLQHLAHNSAEAARQKIALNDELLLKLVNYDLTLKNAPEKSDVAIYVDDPLSYQNLLRYNYQSKLFDNIFFPNKLQYEKDFFGTKRLQYSFFARASLTVQHQLFFSIKNNQFHALLMKYKRRIKTLTLQELSLIYLKWLSLKQDMSQSALVVSSLTSNSLKHLAHQLNMKLLYSNFSQNDLDSLYKNNQIVLAYDGLNKVTFEDNDASLGKTLKSFRKMALSLLKMNLHPFAIFKELYESTGNWLLSTKEEFHTYETNDLLVSKLNDLKKLGDYKILRHEFFSLNNAHAISKFYLENNQWIALVRDAFNPHKLLILTESSYPLVFDKKNSSEEIFFHKILESIEDYTPIDLEVRVRKRDIFKYLLLFVAIIIITAVTINYVYRSNSESGIFTQLRQVTSGLNSGFIWIMIADALLFFIAGSLLRYSLLKKLGAKPLYRHNFLLAIQSSFISFITPFQIGGDFYGYWYLKRKNIKPSILASTFISATIIYQFGLLISSVVFAATGFGFYQTIYEQNPGILFTFIGATAFSVVSIIFIFSISLFAKFQNWAVSTYVKILETIPIWIIEDPLKRVIKMKNGLNNLRTNLFFIWKKPFFLIYLLILEILPRLIIGIAFVNLLAGFLRPGLPTGQYYTQIIAFNTIFTTNSLSFTPGGAGSFEVLYIFINSLLYKNDLNQAQNLASVSDLLNKIFQQWPIILTSFLLLIVIIIGEKRHSYLRQHNHNVTLTHEGVIKKSNYFRYATIFFIIFLILLIVAFYLIAYL